ncbi:uncharacterized protein B0I36DRAFT_128191 [Microdochium trichocladiopsis]|uniref:Uncharacterized protein n=1 Tax=Microdochium trichocladiopsis TaxID=1682393 RepID=A0A9P9BPB7_9PEZI|nr:uncharacterized protein B0I36DRAFT_128191 [Microdochium trichocladiopsis]KAH7029082.1 hypothetical protein B0I36DRAFT_128191 [Microdochium trichocladiopsis]
MESFQGKASQDEIRRLSIPQVYVHLQFGVSWSPRHTPQTHGMTYMSKSLRNSSDFPRQVGQPVPRLVTKQTRPRDTTTTHHYNKASAATARQHNVHQTRRPEEKRQSRPADAHRHQRKPESQRQPRGDTRGPSNDRGNSAPPASHNNPWVGIGDFMTPAVPPTQRSGRLQTTPPHVWKTLPATPSQFRLGADGQPWSSWAYPEGYPTTEDGQEITEELAVFANNPTTVNLATEGGIERRPSDDPARIQELEKLSLAMVTVDNGFENQWWYQGSRESTDRIGRGVDDTEIVYSPHSDPGDNRLVSALEQDLTGPDWSIAYDKTAASVRMMVSPISENSMSPVGNFQPVQRSMTTRSEELFIGS